MSKKILLVNPWIYDFAAYDFWAKPLGLLQIGNHLQHAGYHIELLDCLDRHHPAFKKSDIVTPKSKENGTGKYNREIIKKPDVLSHIDRYYCRYGLPVRLVKDLLINYYEKPDLICLTSIMTYWYPAVLDMFKLLKQIYPETPVILGGIYASLAPEHARTVIDSDHLFIGSDIKSFMHLVNDITGASQITIKKDKGPYPSYHLYNELESVAILTSVGCPNRCSFCASHILQPRYYRRDPFDVYKEMEYWYIGKDVKHFAFYDDALLHKSKEFIEPLLRQIVKSEINIHLHTPNGIQPRYVDKEFAKLYTDAGGHTIRLSFETIKPERQQKMSAKVNNNELENAIQNLLNAGFKRNNIGVYILMGLPDQDMEEVEQSVKFVKSFGVKPNIASYSPIPGTVDWNRTIEQGLWKNDNDLLLTNTTVFPIWSVKYGYYNVEMFMQYLKQNYINNFDSNRDKKTPDS